MSSPHQLDIGLRNDLAELGRVNHLLESFARQHGLPPELGLDCTLALDEVLTNIISYAFADDAAHDIAVRVRLDDQHISIEVEDDGVAFDPLSVPSPDLQSATADRPIGGLGMHFVRALMPYLDYRRDGPRNILRMSRPLTTAHT